MLAHVRWKPAVSCTSRVPCPAAAGQRPARPRGRRATRTSTSLEPSPRDAIDQTSTRTGFWRKAATVRAHDAGTSSGRRERGDTRGGRVTACMAEDCTVVGTCYIVAGFFPYPWSDVLSKLCYKVRLDRFLFTPSDAAVGLAPFLRLGPVDGRQVLGNRRRRRRESQGPASGDASPTRPSRAGVAPA